MRRDADILIAGGGLNGPVLALALAGAGLAVEIIDAAPAGGAAGGRSYALALASQRLLAAVGVWPALAAEAQPIRGVRATDGRPGEGAAPFFLDLPDGELEEGPMGYMVEDRHLRPALAEALAACAGVTVRRGESVVAQETAANGVEVTLASGASRRGELLVGADGRQSGTAARAGIRRMRRAYAQTALVATIAHAAPHHGIAHQFFMPEGPLAILPLRGDRSAVVWSCERRLAEGIAGLDDAGFLTALRPRFGDFLGGLSLEGARHAYPLDLTLAGAMTGARLALVGDAAHGVHPVAGQGLNLGLRDVATLAEVVVAAHRRGEDIGAPDVLDRYAAWRRFDSASLAAATDGFARLFSNDNPLLRAGRDAGLGLVSHIPALRRGFMREAAGLTGELPRLLQGRAL